MKRLLFAFLVQSFLAVSCSTQTIQISGTLLGYDGNPVTVANVTLYPVISEIWLPKKPPEAIQSVRVTSDGTFRFNADTTGVFTLIFSGVSHAPEEVFVLLSEQDEQIELNVQLATYTYKTDFSNVAVIGDFNDFAAKEGARPMEHKPNGTYFTQIEIQTDTDTLAYQLINVVQDAKINGTLAERYTLKSHGHYVSIVDVKDGIARIIFDPAQLRISATKPSVAFRNQASETAKLADLVKEIRNKQGTFIRQRDALKTEGATDAEVATFMKKYDWTQYHDVANRILESNHSQTFKRTALIFYLAETRRLQDMASSYIDASVAHKTLQLLGPTSPLWSAFPAAVYALSWANFKDGLEGYEPFLKHFLKEHPDTLLQANIMYYELNVANFGGKEERVTELYERLLREHPYSKETDLAQLAFAKERAIQEGKRVPDFEVDSLEDPNIVYSNESLAGRTYMIDFWGTWCKPCIAEMPYLHAVYNKYKEQGFTILSLACDEKPEHVAEFRKGEWKMPWLHGYLSGCLKEEENELTKIFEVTGYPTGILVGEDQLILATGPALRDKRLDETLSPVFSKDLSQK